MEEAAGTDDFRDRSDRGSEDRPRSSFELPVPFSEPLEEPPRNIMPAKAVLQDPLCCCRPSAFADFALLPTLCSCGPSLLLTFRSCWPSAFADLPLLLTFLYCGPSTLADLPLLRTFLYCVPSALADFTLSQTSPARAQLNCGSLSLFRLRPECIFASWTARNSI